MTNSSQSNFRTVVVEKIFDRKTPEARSTKNDCYKRNLLNVEGLFLDWGSSLGQVGFGQNLQPKNRQHFSCCCFCLDSRLQMVSLVKLGRIYLK